MRAAVSAERPSLIANPGGQRFASLMPPSNLRSFGSYSSLTPWLPWLLPRHCYVVGALTIFVLWRFLVTQLNQDRIQRSSGKDLGRVIVSNGSSPIQPNINGFQ